MNIDHALAAAAAFAQLTAVFIWCSLYRRVEKWIWRTVLLGFIIMCAHRLDEYANLAGDNFEHFTSLCITGTALFAVIHTRRWTQIKATHTAALLAVQSKLEALRHDIEIREQIAPKIAEIIVDLRAQVNYYKNLAEKHD